MPTPEELAAAEAALSTTKAAFYADPSVANKQAFQDAKATMASLRYQQRQQDVVSGGRGGVVGGDAHRTGQEN